VLFCLFPAALSRRGGDPRLWYAFCDPAAVELPQDKLGKTLLGKWRLQALLGEGGMASVYAATHRNGAKGAVKILSSTDPNEITRFLREGYIVNHIDHPGVVRVLDDDVAEDGRPFLVMELLDGKALDELAAEQGGRLPLKDVLEVMHEVLDALEAAHSLGIIHRDIKPENVFVTKDGRVKLLDFGIAHYPEASGPPSTKTRAGMIMGTPSFMSPEQARARWDLVGPWSDVWSIGATMFLLLTGEFVHVEQTVVELLAATFNSPARALKDAWPEAPDVVSNLVDKALQHKSADRWASAAEMRDAIGKAFRTLYGVDPSGHSVLIARAVAERPNWRISKRTPAAPLPPDLDSTTAGFLLVPRPRPASRLAPVLGVLDVAMVALMIALSLHGRTVSRPGPTHAPTMLVRSAPTHLTAATNDTGPGPSTRIDASAPVQPIASIDPERTTTIASVEPVTAVTSETARPAWKATPPRSVPEPNPSEPTRRRDVYDRRY
jgi:eukaryotic-like serine/threonine-protein kinase